MPSSSMMASNGRARRRFALLNLTLLLAATPLFMTSAQDSRASPIELENPSPGGQQDIGGLEIEQKGVWIDAFDMGMCGDAKFRPWQEAQSAFGCAGPARLNRPTIDASDDVASSAVVNSPRIFGGIEAFEGEFPSYVHMNATIKTDQGQYDGFFCGATLIDKNLAVTAAHCLTHPGKRTLIFGSNWPNGTGGEVRQVSKFCYPRINKDSSHDLAIMRFEEPIKYVNKKIWPACVRLDRRHLDDTTCAFAGLGSTLKNESLESQLPGYLKTLPVKRTCVPSLINNSCYKTIEGGLQATRRGDSGSPLYCYDRCSANLPSRVQAFAVAALSRGPDNSNNVADFNLLRSHFLHLLEMIRREGNESSADAICKVTTG